MSAECEICKQVSKKLDEEDICQSLKDEFIQVEGNLNEAIQENFKYHIIADIVRKFLENKMCEKEASKSLNKDQKISSSALYLNLIKKYLSSESTTGLDLFGLNKEFIDETVKGQQKTSKEKEALNQFVEKNIEDFCIKLMEYFGHANRYRSNWKKAFKACKEDLLIECDKLTAAEAEIVSNQTEISDMLQTYYEDLSQGLYLLKELISLREKKLEFELLLGELYLERCSTLSLKIKRFEKEILKATYHSKNILALKAISKQLEGKTKELEELRDNTNSALQAYSMLGPQYENLVKEYIDLCKSIQQQQWTIESMKQKQSNEECSSDVTAEEVSEISVENLIDL